MASSDSSAALSMRPILGEDGMRRVREFVRTGVLCAFDFDGTLAPIVARPDHARLPEEIRERLVRLAGRTPVAVVTGRSLADVRTRLGFEPAYVVGNHGLEGIPGAAEAGNAFRAACRDWLQQLQALAGLPGVEIEDKDYSLSVHYRLAPDPFATGCRLRTSLPGLRPEPRIVEGKYVFNLLPAHGIDKGHAIASLIDLAGAAGAIYVGDDVTDEDIFRLRRADLLTVRVEPSRDSAAEFFLPRRGDIVRLLDLIVDTLDRRRGLPADRGHAPRR